MADTTIEFEIKYLKGEIKSMHSVGKIVPSWMYERLHRLEKKRAREKRDVEENRMKDCRRCQEWETCPCGKDGHHKGTSIGYSIGECKDYKEKQNESSIID